MLVPMEETEQEQLSEEQVRSLLKVAAIGVAGTVVIVLGILVWHSWSAKRPGAVVLPAGTTYLGPDREKGANSPPTNTKEESAPPAEAPKFTADAKVTWKTVKGNKYSYFFKAPETLNLVTFPNDQYDIYAIAFNNQNPSSNVLIGVDNLNNTPDKQKYVKTSKLTYVQNWWRQFAGLKGVASVEQFTNKEGMKGYKAKFITTGDITPNDDIFFEVPSHPELVIHVANGVLDQSVFDKITDSVGWDKTAGKTTTTTPTPTGE